MAETSELPKVYGRILPSAESYLMGSLMLRASSSLDPEIQLASLIVDSQDREIGFGVNFLPKKGHNQTSNWNSYERGRSLITAEEAAIYRMLRDFCPVTETYLNATMYLTGLPSVRGIRRCLEVNSAYRSYNIKEIIFGPMRAENQDYEDWKIAQQLAKDFDLKVRPFEGNLNWIRDKIKQLSVWF